MINESNLLEEKEQLRSQMNRAKDEVKETAGQWKEKAADSWDDFSDVIRRHPGKALGIALLAGVGLGVAAAAATRGKSRSFGAADKLRDLADTGNDAWQSLRSGFNDALCSLKDAVEDASKKFK